MNVEVPGVVLGSLLGVLGTGFAFAMSTGARLATMSERLASLERKVDGIAEFRIKGTTTPK